MPANAPGVGIDRIETIKTIKTVFFRNRF